MSFPLGYYSRELAGKPKGIKCVLKERGLWPKRGLVLECPTTYNRPGCAPEGAVLAEFLRQSEISRIRRSPTRGGRRTGPPSAFYPKFHCEPNFIEPYWCRAKWFTRESCGFDFEALKAIVPEAIASVSSASTRGFYKLALRAISAYSAGVQYGNEEFKQGVYKSHRQVGGRSEW